MSPQSLQGITTSASTLGNIFVPAVSPLSETDNAHSTTREYKTIKNTTSYSGLIEMRYDSPTETESKEYSSESENDFTKKFNELIVEVNNEIYEESDENNTFYRLSELLNNDGKYFIQYLQACILYNRFDSILLSEILSKLGVISRKSIYDKNILWILQNSLFNEDNLKIRYGAILGLSYIKPYESLARLHLALRNETNPVLKKDIENLINSIKS